MVVYYHLLFMYTFTSKVNVIMMACQNIDSTREVNIFCNLKPVLLQKLLVQCYAVTIDLELYCSLINTLLLLKV